MPRDGEAKRRRSPQRRAARPRRASFARTTRRFAGRLVVRLNDAFFARDARRSPERRAVSPDDTSFARDARRSPERRVSRPNRPSFARTTRAARDRPAVHPHSTRNEQRLSRPVSRCARIVAGSLRVNCGFTSSIRRYDGRMSKSNTTETIATTLSNLAGRIESPALTKVGRRRLRARNEIVPDALVELVSHLAEQGNGSILGVPFDAAAARATLDQTSDARTAILVGKQLLARMEDDLLQRRTTVADPVFALYVALRRLVKTKAGNPLAPAYAEMKAIVKNRPRKPRKKRSQEGGKTGSA
jgi:hypothetical protein